MAQEAQTESATLARALDDAGNVGHYKRAVAAIVHDAQLRLHGSKRIIGDFRACCAHGREQRGFPGIGKTDQTHIGQQLKLQNHGLLDSGFAGLGVAGSPIGSGFEIPVAQAAAATSQELDFLAVVGHLTEVFAGLCVEYHRAAGHFNYLVFAVLAERASGAPALAVGGKHVARIF